MNLIRLLLSLAVLTALVPNARAGEPNLVLNPSFEDDTAWTSRQHPGWHRFELTPKRPHSGRRCAQTVLEKHPVTEGAQIWGALQEFKVSKLPRKIGVWYRIENWKQATGKQYVQVVVMIHDKRLEKLTTQPQMQVRYILAGLSEPPYPNPVNGRYLMAGPKKPRQGRWVHFERNLVDDFVKAWGWYPENFQRMEIFLEARYDEPVPEGIKVTGEVYWDDAILMP
ncbi:MAG TPA: hypothetical protein VLJ37_07035 [bacterium]|nr:hypothetical protein [bacterium]